MRDAYDFFMFFTISSERFAKGARKMRERRIHSSHVLPKKQHITMTFWLLPFIRADNNWFINCNYSLYSSLFDLIYLIPDTNSWFWKMQPLWGRERRRKICERGVLGNFYLAQPPYISIYRSRNVGNVCRFHAEEYAIPPYKATARRLQWFGTDSDIRVKYVSYKSGDI